MGSFLFHLLEKRGVLWRGCKVSALFGLGFCTHNALTIYPNELSKQTQQVLARAKSCEKDYRARLANVKEVRKELDDVLQVCRAELATVEEHKRELEKARQPEPVETWCESNEESAWIFMSEMEEKKRSDGTE
ncbi:uncharacterized protein LOC108863391 [Raphanus sativus]|uniref:Uncharacterized protein LOC108863391 n=1 Tax=Raphanus sativus TaxID=3726 RepID=A0A6J0P9E9_RAPSA|nr:uncharacterized protein LOC108863391 [Raphanus sativus]XP_018493304.1 uncharacterized protein LOC108863391 [Raphanus sativus]